jgi:integrase
MAGLPKPPTPQTNPTLILPNTTLNLLIQLKNDGQAETTIQSHAKRLKRIAKFADINNPETVKQYIANLDCTNTYKMILTKTYAKYCNFNQIQWTPPHYKPDERAIQVPTKEKLEMIIANAGKKMATKLSLSMEGLRPIEVCNLKPKDIDHEQRLITPTTAKHGAARTLKIPQTLNAMLQEHIIRHNIQPNQKLFDITSRTYSKMYRMTRNALAQKLHDPTLTKIRLYDFRHYFATALYKKTNNILIVMNKLGHKDIKNTMIYTHLTDFAEDDYITQSTNDRKQAETLLNDGFDYITTAPDGYMMFRKRK